MEEHERCGARPRLAGDGRLDEGGVGGTLA
jgi:hypothetical protein